MLPKTVSEPAFAVSFVPVNIKIIVIFALQFKVLNQNDKDNFSRWFHKGI